MTPIKITAFALLITWAAQAQTKISVGIENNFAPNGVGGALGFEVEQKLDLHYGFCLGFKWSEYSNMKVGLTYPTIGRQEVGKNFKFLTVPVGIHYYFNPRLYAKGYVNILIRRQREKDFAGYDDVQQAIKNGTASINYDLGATICYFYSSRTQISMGPRLLTIFSFKKDLDYPLPLRVSSVKHFAFFVNFNFVLFRVKARKI